MEKSHPMITRIIETILRYSLGLIMVAYGLIKIMGIQFELSDSVYESPLKELDGVTLTWAFLGYSPFFSRFIGFLEFIPGAMLLFNRTKLIGAILLLPSLVAVVILNNAFGFLLHMQIFTFFLFLINCTILIFNHKIFYNTIMRLLERNPKRQFVEMILNLILIGIIFCLILCFRP
ncbi:MAG: DoxX family membrane protein [Flammeovirgaceae bacterium]|nr:DoxX family membrane protein [Flammeovirgaceae bacterium]